MQINVACGTRLFAFAVVVIVSLSLECPRIKVYRVDQFAQIKLADSPSHYTLTPGQTVLSVTSKRRGFSRAVTNMSSLV